MKMIDRVYNTLLSLENRTEMAVSAHDISQILGLDRSTVSRYLNTLFREKKIDKLEGRPVLYTSKSMETTFSLENISENRINSLDKLTGSKKSLSLAIEKAKAAIIYPPKGLHTLLLGETGVGKSLFAEQMYEYAKEVNILDDNAPFVRFNCADYVNNPNLLTGQIFGVKKGAFTGADYNKDGLLKKADNGVLFLDEIHRLTPEGQEMLFTYIDKGYFMPLGETEQSTYVNVRIIAATTEEPESYLLRTFSRRIPMVIRLPSLNERSIEERYALVESFIREESRRLGRDIYTNRNSIISYLLYDCPSNIGQLKSDIQLSCAKAFLNYKSNSSNYLIINQSDLPNHVGRGLLYINKYRKEVDELLGTDNDILKFSEIGEPSLKLIHEKEDIGEDFYNIIEKKIKSFQTSGLKEADINKILSIDIESHFQRYIGEISKGHNRHEISNVVNKEIIDVVDDILALAQNELNRGYDDRLYFGLSFHIERSVERILQGEKIYNPKLNTIRINYEKEFLFAMKVAKIIEKKFSIEIPVDEIGYLAMFFASDYFKDKVEIMPNVNVMVIMHGHSTASSMVEVVNTLLGSDFVVALDMPLSMKPEEMYEVTKAKIIEMNQDKGIILMVDMGSLTSFGYMITEETGIQVETIDMVSTLNVLNTARKALMGYTINDILYYDDNNRMIKDSTLIETKKEKIILTACFTGDGVARKISDLVKNIIVDYNIQIHTINIIDEVSLEKRILKIAEKYNILAISSAVDIQMEQFEYISITELLSSKGKERIKEIIEEADMYDRMWSSLENHMTYFKGDLIIREIRNLINSMEKKLDVEISKDVKMGLVLHICFMIDNLLKGERTRPFNNLDEFKNLYYRQMQLLKKEFKTIQNRYDINIGENEISYILKTFIENNVSVQ